MLAHQTDWRTNVKKQWVKIKVAFACGRFLSIWMRIQLYPESEMDRTENTSYQMQFDRIELNPTSFLSI